MPKHLADDWRRASSQAQVHFWRSERNQAISEQESEAQPVCGFYLTRRGTEPVVDPDHSANICPFCLEWYLARPLARADLKGRS
jgi:hypothetical protein